MEIKSYIILGLNFGHDAGAAIIKDGAILADVSEERFNRVKHSGDYPLKSIEYCLQVAGLTIDQVDEIALAGRTDNNSFEVIFGQRLCYPEPLNQTKDWHYYFYHWRLSISDFLLRKHKTPRPSRWAPTYCRQFFLKELPKITFVDHHLAHAASAYFTAADNRKMIIATVDGQGDGCSSCIWLGENGRLKPLIKYGQDSSIGWFYSNVTEAIGWWHGDGEGKTMGLAPYGDANKCAGALDGFYPKFQDGALVEPHNFGDYFVYKLKGASHWHSDEVASIVKLVEKFGKENMAALAQQILEEQVMAFVLPWLSKENTKILATAGGTFLNVKLNQRIWMSGQVDAFYPYPNPGDSGIALGAAIYAASERGLLQDQSNYNLYSGPEFSNEEIEKILKIRGLAYRRAEQPYLEAAKYLAADKIIAWFQGRMETGPRALGNRSILMSPKKSENKDIINSRVKFREAFRPFCPSLAIEAIDRYLLKPRLEKFMVSSFDCPPGSAAEIPAVVHVDGTLRPQVVSKEDNYRYWQLITEFGRLTATPLLLNTSFNVLGEPIVCTPADAIRCFFDSGIDVLFLGDFIVEKVTTSV